MAGTQTGGGIGTTVLQLDEFKTGQRAARDAGACDELSPRIAANPQGGFKRFRRATETPFNIVLEARP